MKIKVLAEQKEESIQIAVGPITAISIKSGCIGLEYKAPVEEMISLFELALQTCNTTVLGEE